MKSYTNKSGVTLYEVFLFHLNFISIVNYHSNPFFSPIVLASTHATYLSHLHSSNLTRSLPPYENQSYSVTNVTLESPRLISYADPANRQPRSALNPSRYVLAGIVNRIHSGQNRFTRQTGVPSLTPGQGVLHESPRHPSGLGLITREFSGDVCADG